MDRAAAEKVVRALHVVAGAELSDGGMAIVYPGYVTPWLPSVRL